MGKLVMERDMFLFEIRGSPWSEATPLSCQRITIEWNGFEWVSRDHDGV